MEDTLRDAAELAKTGRGVSDSASEGGRGTVPPGHATSQPKCLWGESGPAWPTRLTQDLQGSRSTGMYVAVVVVLESPGKKNEIRVGQRVPPSSVVILQ